VKTQEYRHIPSFRNAVRRDASAPKMLSYFCASPKGSRKCLMKKKLPQGDIDLMTQENPLRLLGA
jgi:hypothetical protein